MATPTELVEALEELGDGELKDFKEMETKDQVESLSSTDLGPEGESWKQVSQLTRLLKQLRQTELHIKISHTLTHTYILSLELLQHN